VIEPVEDVDEGVKTNSSDIYADCAEYEKTGTSVSLILHGSRNPDTSSYRNIMALKPQA
jgi:hypothetical protein